MDASVSPHKVLVILLTFCLNANISTTLVSPLDNFYDYVVKYQQSYQNINTQGPSSKIFYFYNLE